MTNYSYSTSLPPYREAPESKKRQADEIFGFIKHGANNLLQLSELTALPQSTVSGRLNDLITEGKVKYEGFTVYADRKRKKIVVIKKVEPGIQMNFFTC